MLRKGKTWCIGEEIYGIDSILLENCNGAIGFLVFRKNTGEIRVFRGLLPLEVEGSSQRKRERS